MNLNPVQFFYYHDQNSNLCLVSRLFAFESTQNIFWL